MHLIIALLRDRTLDGRWQGLAVLPRIVMAAVIIYCEERRGATEDAAAACLLCRHRHADARRRGHKKTSPKDKKKPPEKTRGFQEVLAVFCLVFSICGGKAKYGRKDAPKDALNISDRTGLIPKNIY